MVRACFSFEGARLKAATPCAMTLAGEALLSNELLFDMMLISAAVPKRSSIVRRIKLG